MPTEPTTGAHAIALTVSTASIALLGVDHYSLIWGMVGALTALFVKEDSMGRVRSVIYIALSMLVGAAVGTGVLSFFNSESRGMLIVASLIAGFGAQKIVTALLSAGIARIEKIGGDK